MQSRGFRKISRNLITRLNSILQFFCVQKSNFSIAFRHSIKDIEIQLFREEKKLIFAEFNFTVSPKTAKISSLMV